jgi:hypothetical protein
METLLPFITEETERTFAVKGKDGATVKLKVARPNQHQVIEADKQYRVAYSKCLRAGILTHAEVDRYIKDNNIWVDDDNKKLIEVQDGLNKIVEELKKKDYKDLNEGRLKAWMAQQKRDELWKLSRKVGSIYDNTCENASDEIRMQHLCVLTVMKEDGSAFFKDFDDFCNRANEDSTADALRQALTFHSRLKANFILDLDENKWLHENGFTDDNGMPIRTIKEAEAVTLVDQPSTEAPKVEV